MTDKQLDKLFADALAGAERSPRPAAWVQVEARLASSQRQRRPLWGWYMAAAATVSALLMGVYFYSNTDPKAMGNTPLATTTKTQAIEPKTPLPKNNETVAVQDLTEKNLPKSVENYTKSVEKETFSAQKETRGVEKNPIGIAENTLIDDKTLATLDPKTVNHNPVMPNSKPEENTQQTSNTKPEDGSSATSPKSVVPNTPPSSSVLVFNIKESNEVLSQVSKPQTEKKKPFRLGKFLKNLRQFGDGEEVNWQESGVNPPQLLAKADEGIENGREKLTEAYKKIKKEK